MPDALASRRLLPEGTLLETILLELFQKTNCSKILTMMRLLKILIFTEATSFLILLLIAMPLKYIAGISAAVKITGWIHGLLFILFCGALAAAFFSNKVNVQRAATMFIAALIPFAPFCLDWKSKDA